MIIQESVKLAMEVFEQKMEDFANKADAMELTADFAMDFSATLKEWSQKEWSHTLISDSAEKPLDKNRVDSGSFMQ